MKRLNLDAVRREIRPWQRLAAAAAVALPLAACNTDKLVAVSDPAQLPPEALDTPGAVPALINGAVRQFYIGYSGAGDDGFIPVSGVFTDELYYGDTFTTRRALDMRRQQSPNLGNQQDAAFGRLQQARFNARRAYGAIQKYFPTDNANLALMRTVEGYTYVTLGEGWCSYVPFSSVPDTGAVDPTQITHGTPLTTVQMMTTAIDRFNQALALDPSNNLAAVGKARALLDNNDAAGAAAAVADVPTDWVYLIEHSVNTSSESNSVFQLQANGRYGISNDEGGPITPTSERPYGTSPVKNGNGIAYRTLKDPRVPYVGPYSCFSASVPCWQDMNNPSNDADIPLASGVEARLIEAEALLRTGDVAGWLAKLNDLRAQVATLLGVLRPDQIQTFPFRPGAPSLGPLTDPGAALTGQAATNARVMLLMQERNLWMYLTGHRQGDLRRLIRQYGYTQDQVWPTGPYWRSGGTYGTDVAFVVPFNEQNNPNFDANQCLASKA